MASKPSATAAAAPAPGAAPDSAPAAAAAPGQASGSEKKDLGSLYGTGSGAASDASVAVSENSRSVLQDFEQRCAQQLKELQASEERLKQVVVAQEDVALLMREFGWHKNLAERVLRLAGGDLKALIRDVCG